jgi:hypothetical protein
MLTRRRPLVAGAAGGTVLLARLATDALLDTQSLGQRADL